MSPYTHPDWQLLLQAVSAAPADDLPRLVAADWLDDHGDPERAEFIRVQIERERADRPELAWRERALWNNPVCGWRWAAEGCPVLAGFVFATTAGSPLRAMRVSGEERVLFRRGFPFRVACSADEWHRHGAGVVPRQPVRQVALSACDDLELHRFYDMAGTLGRLARVDLDTRSPLVATLIRDRVCPQAEVWANGRPVDDVVMA